MQDLIPRHRHWLKFRDRGWTLMPHPAYSPDLVPSDFYLFGTKESQKASAVAGRKPKLKLQRIYARLALNTHFLISQEASETKTFMVASATVCNTLMRTNSPKHVHVWLFLTYQENG
ncbi:hypothetical protein LAZ67_12003452 [Cordylochernes scorpioides]|uniref:Mariner Mos1 transposase n=1 Tax=Cordylochernes scorpioides TaxID=51811 RepID=A0ABY6L372_9ARAC|nr:hypothetical protein LAZ67_12003452 [Cordylochernes scorpioides]